MSLNTKLRAWRERFLTPETLMRLLPATIILTAGIVLNIRTHDLLSDHRDLVVHTHEVIEMSKDVLIGLDDAETGQRGYLLSSDTAYLKPYVHARERLAWMGPSLKAMVSDNAEQTARADHLLALIDLKLAELQNAITIHDDRGVEAAIAVERESMRTARMDEIRGVIGEMTEGEKSLLAARKAEVDSDEWRVRLVAISIALLSLFSRWCVEIWLGRRRRGENGSA
ncbi:CHASE3 domain-containing protein [Xaviernesmea oryzae]|uniref:CHASE3 domain-containing protein n=1 Tax=Xaviernesmea oryzae TaxID=464029 RepID=UPI00148100CF|nr:CHASE3 domain-containing protein [Xaviernesmea oryzae]